MKQGSNLFSLLALLFVLYSCTKVDVGPPTFKESSNNTIYDYIVKNEADYSSFLAILKKGGIDKTLSAYNPKYLTYTLFLPDNKAVDEFIKESGRYASLDDLLNDTEFVNSLARYHVVRKGFLAQDFPFGTFSEPTLSGDYLNVNYIVNTDTTYYKINNQASVTQINVKGDDDKYFSNGYIHTIGTMLTPVAYNSYDWLKNNPEFSIFTSALEATGIDKIIDVDMKAEDQTLHPFTMLLEPDSIYHKGNIFSFEDLARVISPDSTDYTNSTNPMNQFVGYHILTESKFLNNLEGNRANYNTFADIPLNINGEEIDILINKGKEEFVLNGDTTDYIMIYYDASNVNTQSGAIHFINQILKVQVPSMSNVFYEFSEEQFLDPYRQDGGTYLIESPDLLDNVEWTGAQLFYVRTFDNSETAWSKDYFKITGNFKISYQIPKIVQGKYNVYIRAEAYNDKNALIEVYVDGIKLGGLLDFTTGGRGVDPYANKLAGALDIKKYETHIVEVRSLIPGNFKWDGVIFEIYK
jgi:uncharacterized surface protein with fasciclin (FAS1) repeats